MLPPIAKISDVSKGVTQPGHATEVMEAKPRPHRSVGFKLVVRDKATLPSRRQCVLIEHGSRTPFQFPLKELVLVRQTRYGDGELIV